MLYNICTGIYLLKRGKGRTNKSKWAFSALDRLWTHFYGAVEISKSQKGLQEREREREIDRDRERTVSKRRATIKTVIGGMIKKSPYISIFEWPNITMCVRELLAAGAFPLMWTESSSVKQSDSCNDSCTLPVAVEAPGGHGTVAGRAVACVAGYFG